MKRVLGLLVLVSMVSFVTVAAAAQIKKGKTRVVTTKQLMNGLIKPQFATLGEGLKNAPTDDKGWGELATKAALLNEISYNLMDDGRCPDDVWASATNAMKEGSAAVLAKIEAKDQIGAQEALKAIAGSCSGCHKAHKK